MNEQEKENDVTKEVQVEIVPEAAAENASENDATENGKSKKENKKEPMGSGLGAGGIFDTTNNRGVYASDELDTDRRDFLLNYAAEKVCKFGMSVPAVIGLEMSRPLSFIGSQLVWGAGPLAAVFVNDQYVRELALLMEDRNNIEELIQRIEAIEAVKVAEEKLARQEAKRLKAEQRALEEAGGAKKNRRWWPFGH